MFLLFFTVVLAVASKKIVCLTVTTQYSLGKSIAPAVGKVPPRRYFSSNASQDINYVEEKEKMKLYSYKAPLF